MNKSARTYRIMVIPERNGKGAYSFQVSGYWITAVALLIVIILAASGFVTYKSIRVAGKLHYYNALQNDKERLENENSRLRQVQQKFVYMDSLARYLEQLSIAPEKTEKGTSATKETTTTGIKIATVIEKKAEPGARRGFQELPVEGWITQPFTNDAVEGNSAHPGIDIAAPEGTNIKSPAGGIVTAILQDTDYGTMVVIQHENGVVSRYGHCLEARVSINEKIERGQVLGLVGNTGRSSGPHLHYEVVLYGKNIDPQKYLLPENNAVK